MAGPQQQQQQQQPAQEMNADHNHDGGLVLPPGFRFHPSDEEIVTHYLKNKVLDTDFKCTAIGQVDLNKTEPWQLPNMATMGEREWYFFNQKDRKYPTGMRANRATQEGYWKATGKDKEIYKDEGAGVVLLVGMKKTLVFYKGRAPRGDKTNWVMHEYRLEGSGRIAGPTSASSSSSNAAMKALKDDWVVCRVFHKTTGGKKVHAPPPYQIAMAGPQMDQNHNNIPMPIPIPMPMPMAPMQMQFPMLPDFAMDPYYLNAGAPVPPMMQPMAGIGGAGLQINGALFGNNPMAAPPLMPPFFHHHHQILMGAASAEAEGFVVAPESQTVSMVSQRDGGTSSDQASAADVTSMMSVAGPGSSAMTTMDNMVDGRIWKY